MLAVRVVQRALALPSYFKEDVMDINKNITAVQHKGVV
jgi:hypothetical protein